MQSKKNFSFYSGVDGGPGKTWLFTFFFFNLSLAGLLFQQISNILFPADVWLTRPARLVRPPARIWPASQPTSTATATSTARNYHRLPRLILMILDACLKLKKQNCFLKAKLNLFFLRDNSDEGPFCDEEESCQNLNCDHLCRFNGNIFSGGILDYGTIPHTTTTTITHKIKWQESTITKSCW